VYAPWPPEEDEQRIAPLVDELAKEVRDMMAQQVQ
jgi:hypothetical protein